MANNKVGFIYYNVDTDRYQDQRIKKLKKIFKGTGVAIYDYLLCEIYRVKGCYIEWDESTAFDVADYWDVKEELVNEIVAYCCHVGLFNKELRESGKILSSKSILLRYLDWSKKAKRISAKIPEKLNILLEESTKLPEESKIIHEVCREVKESKVKESIIEAKASVDVGTSPPLHHDPESDLKIQWKAIEKTKANVFRFIRDNRPHFFEPYVEFWNLFATEFKLAKVSAMNDKRKKKLKKRLEETRFDLIEIVRKAKESDFLTLTWKGFGFDWIIENDSNYLKVLEGNYNNGVEIPADSKTEEKHMVL